MTRTHGWAPRGERLIAKVPYGKWETTTFLAALRHDRIDAPCLFDGPINGERFLAYVQQALVPTLRPGVAWHLNARYSALVSQIICQAGCGRVWLHSPILSACGGRLFRHAPEIVDVLDQHDGAPSPTSSTSSIWAKTSWSCQFGAEPIPVSESQLKCQDSNQILRLDVRSRDEMFGMKPEPFGLCSPFFVYELEDGEAFQGLQSLGEVVGVEEGLQVLTQALMALVVIAPNRCVLDGPVHSLNLSVGPGMVGLCQTMVDIVLGADQYEPMAVQPCLLGDQLTDLGRCPAVALGSVKWVPLSVSTVWIL